MGEALGNPIRNFQRKIREKIRAFPLFSTFLAATILAVTWSVVWLTVFFVSTWLFDLTTTAHDFIYLFWLSIAAEAIIRWSENTSFIARLAKPSEDNPRGDNSDFSFGKAVLLLLAGCTMMFFADKYFTDTGMKDSPLFFLGPNGASGPGVLNAMVQHWIDILLTANLSIPLLVGTALRVIIYKRSHRSKVEAGDVSTRS